MKKLYALFLIIIALSFTQVKAQVIFFENFNGISGPTAGGAGTYAFPTGWKLVNVDNRTPAGMVSYVNNAWTRREDFNFNVGDSCAFSTSYYTPTGASNDWMWTPAISLAAGPLPYTLSWRGVAYDPAFADGYEVRIMTVAPTGGTGVIGNMITSSAILTSVSAENSAWTTRNVSIPASYNGGIVYIGFRNNSNDKFILALDDIKVELPIPIDALVTLRNTSQFTSYPFTQVSPLSLGGTIKNNGGSDLTNVNLGAKVYNSSNAVVFTTSGTAIGSLAPGASQAFTLPSYTPASVDSFTIKYFPITTQVEGLPSNDTLLTGFRVSDSSYARDNSNFIGSLGIGAGSVGYLGQGFPVTNTAALSSISLSYVRGYVGRRYAALIWNADGTGKPTTVFASTDTLLYSSDDALDAVIGINGGTRAIPAGNYVVTAVEFDSTIALVQTTEIFTPGTTWVNWPSSPLGDWGHNEDFGLGFSHSYKLRMNLRPLSILPVKLVSFTGTTAGKNNLLTWKVATQFGITSYDVLRSTDNISFLKINSVSATAAEEQKYSFTDADVNSSLYYRLRINENGKPPVFSNTVYLKRETTKSLSIWPNPVISRVQIKLDDEGVINTSGKLLDAAGKTIMQIKITSTLTTLDMNNLSKGTYTLQLEDGRVVRIVKL